ncbi:MAG: type II toxin-antitoxin system PemK/MazF family toxin [bacterium]
MDSFDIWNNLKKKIDSETNIAEKFPKEGEIWMTHLGKNIGYEQNGAGESFSRPVLITKKFNNQMFWIIPLSTKQKNFDFYYNYINSEGLKVSVILAQLKLLSVKRLKRKMGDMEKTKFIEIRNKLKIFCRW